MFHIVRPGGIAVQQQQVYLLASVPSLQETFHAAQHLVAGGLGRHGNVGPALLLGLQPVIGQVEGGFGFALAGRRFDDDQRRRAHLFGQRNNRLLQRSGREIEQHLKLSGLRRGRPASPAQLFEGQVGLLVGQICIGTQVRRGQIEEMVLNGT